MLLYAAILLISYLLGSVSFAIVISKYFYKKDIRDYGSGNAGMTNMLRTFGKKAAAATFVGDFFKGVLAVFIARQMAAPLDVTTRDICIYIAVGGALLGHLKPLYFGFKGGKGISVAFGAMMAATPVTTSMAFVMWAIILIASKMVSLASILCVIGYCIFTFIAYNMGYSSVPNVVAGVIFPAVIVYAHRSNIVRIMNGTENKIGQKKK
ncbi:MAG: glycerol-3-phosphate 1-O-acyltransferase PlsY [Oscillospiraceae bacterium]|nr:glycerol-3-phosphate 1-O-acyltransferase PlsY [Oscillospiraceae bacterium]